MGGRYIHRVRCHQYGCLAPSASIPWSPHNMTGVDKLHDRGIKGKGSIIAIVDTGVDYNHPTLGGGYGPGFKV